MWQLGVCILKSKLLSQSYKYVWIQPLYALRGCAMHHLFPSLLSSRCIDGIESFTGPFASCKPRIGNPSSCMVQEITDSAKPGTTQELRIRSGEWVWKALQASKQTNKQVTGDEKMEVVVQVTMTTNRAHYTHLKPKSIRNQNSHLPPCLPHEQPSPMANHFQ